MNIKKYQENPIKDERVEELMNDYVWISIKKFCELKGISVRTFYNKFKNNLETKKVKNKILIKVQKEKIKKKNFYKIYLTE